MPIAVNTNQEIESMLDLVKNVKYVETLYSFGLEHKLNDKTKAEKLRKIAKYMHPEGLVVYENIANYTTLPALSVINNNILVMDNFALDAFLVLLSDPVKAQDVAAWIKPLEKQVPLAQYVNSLQAVNHSNQTMLRINALLNTINNGNFYNLFRSSNLVKYIDSYNGWVGNTLDNFIKSLPSDQINKVIDDLPFIGPLMPNFTTLSGVLNGPNLATLIHPTNLFCNPCLVNFFNASGLKNNIMTFLNTNIGDANSFLNQKFAQLQLEVNAFELQLNNITVEMDIFKSINSQIDTLSTNITNNLIPADNCSPVIFLLGMLSTLKSVISTQFILPAQAQIENIGNVLVNMKAVLDTTASLKNLIPKLDC